MGGGGNRSGGYSSERFPHRTPLAIHPHVPQVTSLAEAAPHPDWTNLDVIDVPLDQKSLLHSIDKAVKQRLLSTAPTICSHALAFSSGLPIGSMWFLHLPWIFTSTIKSFVAACATGWGSLSTDPCTPALNVEESLTWLETTRLDVGEMETELPATMWEGSEVFSSVLPNLQL